MIDVLITPVGDQDPMSDKTTDLGSRYSYTKPWSTLKTTLKSGVTTVPCGCTGINTHAG